MEKRQLSSSMMNLFTVFLLPLLDVVYWLSIGLKDTHAQSSLESECAMVADTTTPFLQI